MNPEQEIYLQLQDHYTIDIRLSCREKVGQFVDDLKYLPDKAYPDVKQEASEQLALNNYLAHLDHPQVPFGVKQTNPRNLDGAVSTTIELEAYTMPKQCSLLVMGVEAKESEEDVTTVGAVNSSNKLTELIRASWRDWTG